jgi:hypothetical protein
MFLIFYFRVVLKACYEEIFGSEVWWPKTADYVFLVRELLSVSILYVP